METFVSLRFLIVDDMFTTRKIMRRELSLLGVTDISDAHDGQAACDLLRLEAAKGTPFQFVISDWNMPKMTGLELLTYCRNNDPFKNVAFVMLTAEADSLQIEKAQSAGVDHYLLKPFIEQEFKDGLMSVFKKRFSKS